MNHELPSNRLYIPRQVLARSLIQTEELRKVPENQLPGAESHQLCGWGRDTAAQGQPGRTLITLLKQVKCIIDFQFVLKARIITTPPPELGRGAGHASNSGEAGDTVTVLS